MYSYFNHLLLTNYIGSAQSLETDTRSCQRQMSSGEDMDQCSAAIHCFSDFTYILFLVWDSSATPRSP